MTWTRSKYLYIEGTSYDVSIVGTAAPIAAVKRYPWGSKAALRSRMSNMKLSLSSGIPPRLAEIEN